MIRSLCLIVSLLAITSLNTAYAEGVYTNPVDLYNENAIITDYTNDNILYTFNNQYPNKLSLQSFNYHMAPYYNRYNLEKIPNIVYSEDTFRYLYLLSNWQNQNFDYTYNRKTLKYEGQYVEVLSPIQLLDLKEGVCRDFATFTASQLLKNDYPVYFIHMIYDDKSSHLFVATEVNENGNTQLMAIDKGSEVDYLSDYLQKISKPGSENVVKLIKLTKNEEFGTYEFNYEYNISKLNIEKPTKYDLVEFNNSLAKKLGNKGYNIIDLSKLNTISKLENKNITKLSYSYSNILYNFPNYYIDDLTTSYVVSEHKNSGYYTINTFWDVKTSKTWIELYVLT
ncbi:transglutaminase-like domain-containing protein [Methanococcus voltae]|uniref:Transglutaminase-like domain-containing protein n=1 Tax=Methanococcus voltae (strain ATCC BAA-1334 / A3) TaxID=456320 RepID=D7DTF5_METV3|nr:transglutaminase-like domain-containing protein [Methanococcus voltae]MCS3901267.1 hypothetical protein [Methanococcus voltae]